MTQYRTNKQGKKYPISKPRVKRRKCGNCGRYFPESNMHPRVGGVSGKPWYECEECHREYVKWKEKEGFG